MNQNKRIGTCEVCDKPELVLYVTQGGILMCQPCIDDEKEKLAKYVQMNNVVQTFKQVDQTIHVAQDIYNAKTIPMIQLRAAIEQDENIPVGQKDFVFAQKCEEHMIHLKEILKKQRQEVEENENELRAWGTNQQVAIGKLRLELRGQFTARNIDYAPSKPKITKSSTKEKAPKSASKKVTAAQAREAAEKYGVNHVLVLMTAQGSNISAEDAAISVYKKLEGKKKQN
jgi:hypothetical protein